MKIHHLSFYNLVCFLVITQFLSRLVTWKQIQPYGWRLWANIKVSLEISFLSSYWYFFIVSFAILVRSVFFSVRDTFCSYPVMDLCTKGLGQHIPTLKVNVIFGWELNRSSHVIVKVLEGISPLPSSSNPLMASVYPLQAKGVNLACIRSCVVVAEERPRINLTAAFSALFSGLGLSARSVSTSFGCRVNVAICTQVLCKVYSRKTPY
jgi:hypothetical protein